jgi:uncharacterized membrane protein HdeD (DUF308 family)
MESAFVINWWVLALRGVAGILLGIAAFVVTGITLAALILLLAVYLFIDGAVALFAGIWGRSWLLIAEGVIGLAAGIAIVLRPGLALVLLALIVAVWAIFTGIIELGAAVALRRVIKGEWLLAAGGVLSIVFGVMVAIFPFAGLLAIVWIIGAYAIIWGVLFLALALRTRGMRAVVVIGT